MPNVFLEGASLLQLYRVTWKRFRYSLNAKADNMTSTVNMEDFRLLLTQISYYTFFALS